LLAAHAYPRTSTQKVQAKRGPNVCRKERRELRVSQLGHITRYKPRREDAQGNAEIGTDEEDGDNDDEPFTAVRGPGAENLWRHETVDGCEKRIRQVSTYEDAIDEQGLKSIYASLVD
jgi:hypothetical protein